MKRVRGQGGKFDSGDLNRSESVASNSSADSAALQQHDTFADPKPQDKAKKASHKQGHA